MTQFSRTTYSEIISDYIRNYKGSKIENVKAGKISCNNYHFYTSLPIHIM